MDIQLLMTEAKKLTAPPRGILAIDESAPTCNKRFEALGVATTEENRRAYRELLVTANGIEEYLSGMILFDETMRQKTKDGILFTEVLKSKGISIGIKVDAGTKDLALFPGEKVTEGLDGLRERFVEYKAMGATFAKWRAVINIDVANHLPSDACLRANAQALTRYAAICQETNIVPIVEPEIIMDGSHTIEDSQSAISRALKALFAELPLQGVKVEGLVLKTGMVISGTTCTTQASVEEVAEKTLQTLKECVPANIGGIVFLSGGQSEQQATDHLRAMHTKGDLSWNLSFSYGRGIQKPALTAWAKNPADIAGAQQALIEMSKNNSLATLGK